MSVNWTRMAWRVVRMVNTALPMNFAFPTPACTEIRLRKLIQLLFLPNLLVDPCAIRIKSFVWVTPINLMQ
ncbi:MAG TPA: hypothetical protein PLR22_01470 [Saprospiraceae bacterium]|nr:hypothetical protein [Saprospiraceae bacterium]